jgi:hypothetical protein
MSADLLARYDALCQEHGVYSGKRSLSRFREPMEHYAAWCAERQIDPKLFMRFRFEQALARHKAAPSIKTLVSDDSAQEYLRTEAGASLAVFEQTVKPVYDLVGPGNGRIYSLVRDAMCAPEPYVERFRHQQVSTGRAWACRSERLRFGIGYDPRSSVCPRCPEAALCAQQTSAEIGFDITALRRGDFDLLPEIPKKVARHSSELHALVKQGSAARRRAARRLA